MRLADVDELCEAPENGVRETLRPGDLAGLVIVHSEEGWGDGYEPAEARILDVEGPGCYMGEFADGSQVRFNERNVAAVRPALGGVFDWVKKAFKGIVPPTPGMLPALPPEPKPSRLPAQVTPAAPPRGVTPSFLDWFKPKPMLPAVRPEAGPPAPAKPKKPGIFDWLKPKPYTGPTGVVVPPETIITPAVRTPSMFATIQEKPSILRKFEEAATAITVPPPSGAVIETPQMFKHIQPTPEPPPRAGQMQLWQELFPEPETAAQAQGSVADMFKPFEPQEVAPPGAMPGATQPSTPGTIFEENLPPVDPENLKFLPLPSRNSLLPTPLDIARGFMTRYDPIDDLWELIRNMRKDPSFQREVARGMEGQGPGARWHFESLGMCEGNPDAFQAISSFLGIPWQAVVERGRPVVRKDDEGNEYVQLTNYSRINEDIVFPASEAIYQAFELIKPKDLPGHFTIEWGGHKEHSCQLLVSYVEGSPMTPEVESEQAQAPGAAVSTTLGDLLPEAAVPEVMEVLNTILRREIDKQEGLRRLVFVLDQYTAELEAKGVIPAYIAAYLISSIDQMGA